MKLLQVYNQYRSDFNGEDAVVELTAELVDKNGGTARILTRSSRDIGTSTVRKVHAAWSGIYSREACREMGKHLRDDRPDIVHVHNIYPLFSPSILVACKKANVPVVVSVHNQHLTCPRGDHLYKGKICERCTGGAEYHCVLQNCRENILESIAYAARSAFARKMRLFRDNATLLIALNQFAKSRLVDAGFDAEQIVTLPNMVEAAEPPADASQGTYVAFAGRISPEKGIDTLLATAASLPACRVRLAGSGPALEQTRISAPTNAEFLGQLAAGEMAGFYRSARFVVVPSRTYEMCPLVILEAMSHGIPVIASKHGGLRKLVQHGVTGLLFEAGNTQDLLCQMRRLWGNPELCREMGLAGYKAVRDNHSEQGYYRQLINIYERAIAINDAAPVTQMAPGNHQTQVDRRDVSLSAAEVTENAGTKLAAGAKTPKAKVVICQYRLLHYRVDLFQRLKALCDQDGIQLELIHGQPSKTEVTRKDTSQLAWATPVRNRFWRMGGKDILWQPLPKSHRNADLIVFMQESRILSNYAMIMRSWFSHRKVGYWGHGANFQSKTPTGLREGWKKLWINRVDWWFSYTQMTDRLLQEAGFPAANITCLNNAVNTSELKRHFDSFSEAELETLSQSLSLGDHPQVAVSCGSLYPDKKLDLLVAASDLIRSRLPNYHLVVIGDGPAASFLNDAARSRPWLHLVGVQKGRDKAGYLRLAKVMLNPGLLGLHILDSFSTGLPLVSTKNALHSPEIAYLRDGENGLLVDDDAETYADAVWRLFADQNHYRRIADGAMKAGTLYSVENMAQHFFDGIKNCLNFQDN